MAPALAGVIVIVPLLARDIPVAIGMTFGFAFFADGVGAGHMGEVA